MNKKGFTLIEILSALVIIAILSGMAIIGTSTFFKSAEDRYYETIESNILLAGNDYFTDHRDMLPTENNYSEISLDELVADKYMEEVKDSEGNICNDGVVYAYRDSGQYRYEVCLKCSNYTSSGSKCEERVSRDIHVSAKQVGTSNSYDVLKSYNSVPYSNKDIEVTFRMENNFHVSKYVISSVNNSIDCTNIINNNSCTTTINQSGSYKVSAYDIDDKVISTKYINVRIAKTATDFSLDGDAKYTIDKTTCNSNDKVDVTIDIIKNISADFKTIEYRINKINSDGTIEGTYKETTGTTISESLESGHYQVEVVVTNYANITSVQTKTIDITYMIDILYDDDNSTGTHEVVNGQPYNYLSNLPTTKMAYGQNLEIKWYKNNTLISADSKVTETCPHTIVGRTAIPVDPVDFSTYCKNNLVYTGSEQVLTNTPPANVTFVNNTGTNANTYTVKAHINEPQYVWSDASTGDKTFTCKIKQYPTSMSLNATSGTVTYGTNGNITITTQSNGIITCSSSDTSVATCTVSNNTVTVTPKALNADGKTATITINQAGTTNYEAASATYAVTVNRKTITSCPSSPSEKTYTGSAQSSGITCPTGSSAGGTTSATNVGTYTQTCTANAGYKFASACSVSWKIGLKPVTMSLSATSGTLTYGTNGTVTVTTDSDGAISCTTSDSNVATCSVSGKTITITPKANTADNKTATITISQAAGTNHGAGSKTYTVTVNRKTLTCPSSPSNKTFNGSSQASGISCPTGSSAGGSTSATSAGTYSQTCTAGSGYKFASTCSVSWKIIQKAATMSLNATSGTLTYGTNGTVTVTTDGDGAISCSTSDSNVATCSVSGKTVTITPKANTADSKTATITISQAAGTNYSAPASKTYSVTVNRKTLTCPSSPANKTFNGSSQASGISCPGGSSAGGTQSATNVGTYSQTCTAGSGYKFASACSVSWKIVQKAATMSLNATSGTLTYGTNGTVTVTTDGDGAISCSTSDSNIATCSVSGKTVTLTPKANTADSKTATITISQAAGTNYSAPASKTYTATVNRKTLTCPSSPSNKTYTGSAQNSGISCPGGSSAGGTTSATNVGTYSQTCTAGSGYKFASACSVSWKIVQKAATMSINATSGTLTYGTNASVTVTTDGDGAISCTTSDANVATCSVSGKTVTITPKANTADSKTATITIKQAAGTNYSAPANKTYTATVNRKTLTCPSSPANKTYTGSAQNSGISCPGGSSAGGTTSATNAGTYSHTCTASSGYKFASTCSVSWKIVQKATTMSINASSGTLTYGTNASVTVTTDGNGAISCTTSDANVATCSVSGKTVTITPKANTADSKTATITIKQAAGTNYSAPANKTYTATVNRKTLTCPSSPSNKTYNGSSQASGISCPGGSSAGGTTSATSAGTYSQTCTASSGYKFASACSVSWKIVQKAIGSCTAGASRTYNGSSQTSGVTCPTGASASGTTSATNVGSYSVTCTGSGNYTGSCTSSWSIGKATAAAPTLTGATASYDGANHCITKTGGTSGLTVKYAWCNTTNGTSCSGNWSAWGDSTSYYCGTGVGKWLMKAYTVGNSNYNDSGASNTVVLTINKATLTCPSTTYVGWTGSAVSSGVSCPSGSTTGGTTSATNAGSYTQTCTADGNHQFASACSVTWKICKWVYDDSNGWCTATDQPSNPVEGSQYQTCTGSTKWNYTRNTCGYNSSSGYTYTSQSAAKQACNQGCSNVSCANQQVASCSCSTSSQQSWRCRKYTYYCQ